MYRDPAGREHNPLGLDTLELDRLMKYVWLKPLLDRRYLFSPESTHPTKSFSIQAEEAAGK